MQGRLPGLLGCSSGVIVRPVLPHYIVVDLRTVGGGEPSALRRLLAAKGKLDGGSWSLAGPSSSGNPEEEWCPPGTLSRLEPVRGVDVATEHGQRKASASASRRALLDRF